MPHKDFDHPFVRDYYNGISKAEAEARIADMMGKTKDYKEPELPESFLAGVVSRFRKLFAFVF